jgi:hypothetical protein
MNADAESSEREEARHQARPQRADFEEGDEAVQDAKKGDGGLSRPECSSVSDAFKRSRTTTRAVEARFNQGAVLYECGRDDEAARVWRAWKYGPAITTSATSPGRTTSRPRRVAVQEGDRRRSAPQRRSAQQHGADPARQGAQGREREDRKSYVSAAVSNLRTVLAL